MSIIKVSSSVFNNWRLSHKNLLSYWFSENFLSYISINKRRRYSPYWFFIVIKSHCCGNISWVKRILSRLSSILNNWRWRMPITQIGCLIIVWRRNVRKSILSILREIKTSPLFWCFHILYESFVWWWESCCFLLVLLNEVEDFSWTIY